MTTTKDRVLIFIIDYIAEFGEAPSSRKIAECMGYHSHKWIQDRVNTLVKDGYLHKTRGYVTGLTGKHLEDSK